MGCGAAKVAPQPLETDKLSQIKGKPDNNHEPRTNGQIGSPVGKSNGHIESKIRNQAQEGNGNITSKQDNEISNNVDSQEIPNRQPEALSNTSSSPSSGTVPLSQVNKAVAFDIVLGQQKLDKLSVSQKPPRRLKKIESAPTLTREALEQKQAIAEQNRQKELEKKAKVMSKRRSELILAREMDKAQQQKAELEEKLAASEKKREKAKAEVVAKQKRREEKAKRVREMALQIKEGSDVVNVAVDHDDTYNVDEEDESWDVNTSASHNSSVALGENNSSERASSPVQEIQPFTRENETVEINTVHDFFDS